MFKEQGTPAETSNNANAISRMRFRNFRLPALRAILVASLVVVALRPGGVIVLFSLWEAADADDVSLVMCLKRVQAFFRLVRTVMSFSSIWGAAVKYMHSWPNLQPTYVYLRRRSFLGYLPTHTKTLAGEELMMLRMWFYWPKRFLGEKNETNSTINPHPKRIPRPRCSLGLV